MAGGRSMEFTFLKKFELYHAVMDLREAREKAKQNPLAGEHTTPLAFGSWNY